MGVKSTAIRKACLQSITLLFVLLTGVTGLAAEPLIHSHAHNDYEHKRPLFDALDNGFCSIEADIYLVEGKLLVAHNFTQVKPERTLQALYLDPLRAQIKQNGGRVYAGGPQVTRARVTCRRPGGRCGDPIPDRTAAHSRRARWPGWAPAGAAQWSGAGRA